MHALDGVAHVFGRGEPHRHVNPPDHEHAVFGFDFARHVRAQLAAARVDLARLQRAAKGAEHSTGRRRHDVVERRGVGLGERRRIDFVVLRDRAMHAEDNRLRLTGQTYLWMLPIYGLAAFLFIKRMADVTNVEAAIKENTRMVFLETPTNPVMIVTDLQAVSDVAHAAGARVVWFEAPSLRNPGVRAQRSPCL